MKTKLTYLVLVCFITLIFQSSKAQTTDSTTFSTQMLAKPSYRKNNVKINLSSLALKNYSLYYERSLSRKISFTAGYRTMPMSNLAELPLLKKITEQVSEDGEELIDGINDMSASNTAYTGEFRFYGGKHPGARGFYLSLYGRYADINVDYNYTYQAQSGSYNIPIKSNFTGLGGGLMIGAQWLIAKRVTFDWYILGGHYGKLSGTGNGVANLSALSEQDKENIKNDIESTGSIGGVTSVSATVNDNGIIAEASGPFIGLRGLGFSLGFAF